MSKKNVTKKVIGKSVEEQSIEAWQFGTHGEVIHFYGGFHGDEPEGVALAFSFRDYLIQYPKLFSQKTLIIVPLVNPDGYKNKTRVNANKVDLNRNFPTQNWTPKASQPKYYPGPKPSSEPEVNAIVDLIEKIRPSKIISIHSLIPHQINYDGPAKELAYVMAKHNHYPVTEHIGYPTPGSLGDYAGEERNIAVITYELAEKISPQKAWEESKDAFIEAIQFFTDVPYQT